MNMWLMIVFLIEAMAVIGIIGVAITHRTSIAFAAGFNTMLLVTLVYVVKAPIFGPRQLIIIAMVLLYLLHMNWLLFFQIRHTAAAKLDAKLPAHQKYLLSFILTNAVGWGYCLPFYFAAQRTTPLNIIDFAAIIVYVLGTIMHFGSDYQKKRFKEKPESKGHLLQTGFWKLCRHPNYFGDLLIYIAFALIGGNLWGWLAPLLNFLQYRFDAIPKSEQWAQEHYGSQWESYRQKVKMFIPYLY